MTETQKKVIIDNAMELLRIASEWKKTPGHLPFLLTSIEELTKKQLEALEDICEVCGYEGDVRVTIPGNKVLCAKCAEEGR